MSNNRLGCKYCFNVLDPQDNSEEYRSFVKCVHCRNIYHLACWNEIEECVQCNNNLVQPINVPSPQPLRIPTRTKAAPIKPSTVVYIEDGVSFKSSIQQFIQIVRAIIVAVFLLIIAVFVGVFVYRITRLTPIDATTIMDAIFKQAFPPILTFTGALISGVIFTLVFYNLFRSNTSHVQGKPGWFTHFLAGIIVIVGLDIWLFGFTSLDLIKLNINLRPYEEVLYAQAATAFMIILLTPLHKGLAPITISSHVTLSPLLRSIYGWARLLFVSLLLNLAVVYLSIQGLPSSFNLPKFADISLGFTKFPLTLPMIGAFAAGIAISSIVYWPPKFRQLTRRFGILRLLLVIVCIIAIGFMYRLPMNPEGYLSVVITACTVMFIAIPVQRSLS